MAIARCARVLAVSLVLLLATTTDAPAALAATKRGMTLPEALAYAREHQPSLEAVRARLAAVEMQARVPSALWYPRLGATAQLIESTENNSTASYVSSPWVDLPRIGGTRVEETPRPRPFPSTLAAVGLRQEVFDFGRIGTLAAAERAAVDVERWNLSGATLDLALAVEEAFFAVHAAKATLEVARGALDRGRVVRETAAAGVKAGLRRPIDLTRAEADLGRLEVARIRGEGGVRVAEALFAAVVGVPDQTLDAVGDPSAASEPPSLDEAIAAALAQEPAVRQLEALARAQAARTTAIAAELRPDLFASGTVSGRAGGAPPSSGPVPAGQGWLPDVPNWHLGLVLSWPLYDAGVLARRDASRSFEAARRAEVEAAKQRLVAAVQQAYEAVLVAREALPALERSASAAKANYDQADARFRGGLGTALELADAEALRSEAEIQLALGRFELARARARLARTMAKEI
jgi:outer membrane protein TolC